MSEVREEPAGDEPGRHDSEPLRSVRTQPVTSQVLQLVTGTSQVLQLVTSAAGGLEFVDVVIFTCVNPAQTCAREVAMTLHWCCHE